MTQESHIIYEQSKSNYLYTISDVANTFGVSKKTVYSMLNTLKEEYPQEQFFVRMPFRLRFSQGHIDKIIRCLNSKRETKAPIGKSKEQPLADNAFDNPQVAKAKKKLR